MTYVRSDDDGNFTAKPDQPLPGGEITATVYQTTPAGTRSKDTTLAFEIVSSGPLHALLNPISFVQATMPRGAALPVVGLVVAALLVFGGGIADYIRTRNRQLYYAWKNRRQRYALKQLGTRVSQAIRKLRSKKHITIKRNRDQL